jgi:hypothetical protein
LRCVARPSATGSASPTPPYVAPFPHCIIVTLWPGARHQHPQVRLHRAALLERSLMQVPVANRFPAVNAFLVAHSSRLQQRLAVRRGTHKECFTVAQGCTRGSNALDATADHARSRRVRNIIAAAVHQGTSWGVPGRRARRTHWHRVMPMVDCSLLFKARPAATPGCTPQRECVRRHSQLQHSYCNTRRHNSTTTTAAPRCTSHSSATSLT